jgi:YARHG domain
MRIFVALLIAGAAHAGEFQPAPAESVTGYSAGVLPCKIEREDRTRVVCKSGELEKRTLRELSILRNTIYARYGWDGYRKVWLRDYFHAQPWFKANPKFTYKVLSDADRKNAHLIAAREQSLTDSDLREMREKIQKHKPLTADDKVELGLIDRSMGSFALDDDSREKAAEGLDRILKVGELRQLSLRDLRLLRNTIYARHGRPFKSEILRDHFSGMSWYHVDAAYTDKLLSANDARNIALIKSVENEFGGPLSDEDWLTEPAVDGA